jgi:two-component system, LuxR family, sensor kinase FixL
MNESRTGAVTGSERSWWPIDGGAMGHLIRTYAWSTTPLGPIDTWAQSLKTAVDICLASPEPASVLWGPERIQLYNDAYIAIAQDRHPAILGRPALENWSDAYDLLVSIFDRLVGGGSPTVAEDRPVSLRRADGNGLEQRFFTFSFSVIRDESGAMGGIFNRVTETTARKRAEERERELQAELLHVSRLAAMGQIASIIAHELNQPLAAIANYAEGCCSLLQGSEITDAGLIRDALVQVSQQALHAGQILRRVRGFVGRRGCERERVDIADLLHQASTLAVIGSKPHSPTVSVRSDGRTLFVLGDKTQLQQVVFNLVRNGVEAMQESERREVLIATAPAENNMVEVSIADTGCGIDEEIRSQLFEPFVTTKRHGMGIGLSLCRTIIEDHGGQLWAEPGPNSGTVFRFTLPAVSDVE